MKKNRDLTQTPIPSVLMKMTIPIVAGKFLQTGYNLIDTLFVSRIGATEVGAVTFVMPIVLVILSLAHGLSVAGISLISQSKGAGKESEAASYMGQLFLIGFILSLVIAAGGYFRAESIMSGLKLSGPLLEATKTYVAIIFLSAPFTFFNTIYDSIRNSEGQARKALAVLIISLILNIIFNYLFIFHFQWGIKGAALATLVARFCASVYGMFDLLTNTRGLHLKIKDIRFSKNSIKLILRLGIPAAFAKGTTSLGFVIINIFVVQYGTEVLAAFGIGSRINSIFFMPSTGFGMALAAVAGQNLGAGKPERARKAVQFSMLYSLGFSVIAAFILYTFAFQFSSLFSSDPLLIGHTMNFLKVVAITVIPWGIFQVITGLFDGSGFTKTSMMISLIRLWLLRIPLLILLSKFTNWGENSIWYSMFISNTVTALASIALYYIIPWDKGLKEINT
jgi:putative MATE family efflux protein